MDHLAIDIGASGGKIFASGIPGTGNEPRKIDCVEIRRFENKTIENGVHSYWDLDYLFGQVLEGLAAARAQGIRRCTVGIDAWGVDYVLVDGRGGRIGHAYCYRDPRTDRAMPAVLARLGRDWIFEKTGIQFLPFNTLYQLSVHDRCELERAARILLIPDYLNYLLTGRPVSEETIASTTQLLNLRTRDFDPELLAAAGARRDQFGDLVAPPSSLGPIRPELRRAYGLPDCEVICVAAHDTASAVLGAPLADKNAVYISSGTWSLVGIESDRPLTSAGALERNFTNEWGAFGTYRFLKNLAGLWPVQELRREAGDERDFADLMAEAESCAPFRFLVDCNAPAFLHPASMAAASSTDRRRRGASSGARFPPRNTSPARRARPPRRTGDSSGSPLEGERRKGGGNVRFESIRRGEGRLRRHRRRHRRGAREIVSRQAVAPLLAGGRRPGLPGAPAAGLAAAASLRRDRRDGRPGAARCAAELRQDLERALECIPGAHKVNLHAMYAETDGRADLDELEPAHFRAWLDWAAARGLGLDFNPTCFSHPLSADGFTLSHPDEKIRSFRVRHCVAARRIGEHFGPQLEQKCVTNLWIPDGYKDVPADRSAPRLRLKESLDEIFSAAVDGKHNLDTLEGKLFGLGVESYTVGSHEFYLAYALKHGRSVCLDTGHFHPAETVSGKISTLALFFAEFLLHLSRPVRWDSDHVVALDDELFEIAAEVVRYGLVGRVHLGLDYFDASVNRVAAWVIGARNALKAFLRAFLEPTERLRRVERGRDYTSRLAWLEELKGYPWAAVWDRYCEAAGVPVRDAWLPEIQEYETAIIERRR